MPFCSQCGVPASSGAAFCSSRGTALALAQSSADSDGGAAPPPAYQLQQEEHRPAMPQQHSSASTYSHHSAYQPPAQQALNPNRLFEENGQRTDLFEGLARAIFIALDQAVHPQNTGGLEQSKMEAFRRECGLQIPPHYDRALALYYQVNSCSTHPVQAPVLTQAGFSTFLEQKIKLEPSDFFPQLSNVLRVFGIGGPGLKREDLPQFPDPAAQAREQQFRQTGQQMIDSYQKMHIMQAQAQMGVAMHAAQAAEDLSRPAGSYRYY